MAKSFSSAICCEPPGYRSCKQKINKKIAAKKLAPQIACPAYNCSERGEELEQQARVENDRMAVALEQSAQGDSLAFAQLVQQHQGMVFSIAYHFLQDRSLAEDLAQEVFLELYQNLGAIQSPAHLTYWLRRVTSNRCIDHG